MPVVDAGVWVAAADPADEFSAASRAFFRTTAEQGRELVVPSLARVEIACALARRLADGVKALEIAAAMLDSPLVRQIPLDAVLLDQAVRTGTGALLRGADAVYVATALAVALPLVAWDRELIERAGAVRPGEWSVALG